MTLKKFLTRGSWGTEHVLEFEPMSDELERRLTERELHLAYSRGASLGESFTAMKSLFRTILTKARASRAVPVARPVEH